MEQTVFYRKEGRRYQPVLYYDTQFRDAFPPGCHLVVVKPGEESCIYNVDPDAAPLLAALQLSKEKVMDVMRKAADARPFQRLLTQTQEAAYEQFKQTMGGDNCWFLHPSMQEIYDTLVEELVKLTHANDAS